MEALIENISGFIFALVVLAIIMYFYLRKHAKKSQTTTEKIIKAKEFGLYEPVSLHPVVNQEICIGSGACIQACPEKDILGIVHGKATTINASRCIGHGACFNACPVKAITLCIGTEKRGVELPHISPEFETNIPGLFVAGELGGMGLIKNAVEQGKQAVYSALKRINKSTHADFDIAIIGAGPAGLSATLAAKEKNLSYITFEQDSLGGTINSFPRGKIVMTSPMVLPLFGKIKLTETTKSELLELWEEIFKNNGISIHQQEKVVSIKHTDGRFEIESGITTYTSRSVIIAIGRRGTPRKLGVPGEDKPKVYYRLLEPELLHQQKILVVGGGDSAIESALLLAEEKNEVTISYRNNTFARLKEKNLEKINEAVSQGLVNVIFDTEVLTISDKEVTLIKNKEERIVIENDLVYVFIGGELPTQFLQNIGITISKKHGDVLLSHK